MILNDKKLLILGAGNHVVGIEAQSYDLIIGHVLGGIEEAPGATNLGDDDVVFGVATVVSILKLTIWWMIRAT